MKTQRLFRLIQNISEVIAGRRLATFHRREREERREKYKVKIPSPLGGEG